jgi:hypothetical protein
MHQAIWNDTHSPLATRILAFLRDKGMASEELISEMLCISSYTCRETCLKISNCGIIAPEHIRETLMWRHISEDRAWPGRDL